MDLATDFRIEAPIGCPAARTARLLPIPSSNISIAPAMPVRASWCTAI